MIDQSRLPEVDCFPTLGTVEEPAEDLERHPFATL